MPPKSNNNNNNKWILVEVHFKFGVSVTSQPKKKVLYPMVENQFKIGVLKGNPFY